MAGKPREPIELIIAKGKKHLTKEEIAQRKNTEVNTDNYKDVKPPKYLSKKQREAFSEIANKLLDIGIMSELDEGCLARYLIAEDNYLKFTSRLKDLFKKQKTKEYKNDLGVQVHVDNAIAANLMNQDRAYKQCQQSARDLGLTISSRCKLVIPQAPEKPKENKFSKFMVS